MRVYEGVYISGNWDLLITLMMAMVSWGPWTTRFIKYWNPWFDSYSAFYKNKLQWSIVQWFESSLDCRGISILDRWCQIYSTTFLKSCRLIPGLNQRTLEVKRGQVSHEYHILYNQLNALVISKPNKQNPNVPLDSVKYLNRVFKNSSSPGQKYLLLNSWWQAVPLETRWSERKKGHIL